MSLRNHADKASIAEEKYNMSNVAINKFLPLSYLFTQNREELELCRRVHKRQRFIPSVSQYMKLIIKQANNSNSPVLILLWSFFLYRS